MKIHTDKSKENKKESIANTNSQSHGSNGSALQFKDKRPASQKIAQLKEVAQRKPNKTGLPDNLKSGIENLSGHSMDDVKVHYNSAKPAQLQAHAYAQGNQIHLGPGQEKHLPHEAWHVVQQKQGRVKPTLQMKGKVNINDDAGLEKEADVMGAKALQMKSIKNSDQLNAGNSIPMTQLKAIQLWAKGNLENGDFVKQAGNHWQMNFANEAVSMSNGSLQHFHAHASVYTNQTNAFNEFHIKFDDGRNTRIYFFFTDNGHGSPQLNAQKSTKYYRQLGMDSGEFAELRSSAIGLARNISSQL